MTIKERQILWEILGRVSMMQASQCWLPTPEGDLEKAIGILSREEQSRPNGNNKADGDNPGVQRKTKRHPVLPKRK